MFTEACWYGDPNCWPPKSAIPSSLEPYALMVSAPDPGWSFTRCEVLPMPHQRWWQGTVATAHFLQHYLGMKVEERWCMGTSMTALTNYQLSEVFFACVYLDQCINYSVSNIWQYRLRFPRCALDSVFTKSKNAQPGLVVTFLNVESLRQIFFSCTEAWKMVRRGHVTWLSLDLSHYLRGFIHPRWWRISSINSITWWNDSGAHDPTFGFKGFNVKPPGIWDSKMQRCFTREMCD